MVRNYVKMVAPMLIFPLLTGCMPDTDMEKTMPKQESEAVTVSSKGQGSGWATADMYDVQNNKVGTVAFIQDKDHVRIEASVKGLAPGHHGFHIHEKGICDPQSPDGAFMSAGGHFNPTQTVHSNHAGDMPSLYVNKDGTGTFTADFDRMTAQQIVDQKLAVMIHENPDNFGNIPERYQAGGKPGPDKDTLKTGDAGKRIACGIISRENKQ
ncbi:superoxide dismutase family protein [Peribacillus sp. SCS-155]|uniref:superoxide dismutase family protein n=1 Tax=Peribacillus sedimenti TaxID=3115297 RepID=UPI003905D466